MPRQLEITIQVVLVNLWRFSLTKVEEYLVKLLELTSLKDLVFAKFQILNVTITVSTFYVQHPRRTNLIDINDQRDHVLKYMRKLWNNWRGSLHKNIKSRPFRNALRDVPEG